MELLKKIYHRFSGFALVKWLGRVYLHGFFISNFLAYWRLRKMVDRKKQEERKRKVHVVFLAQNKQVWGKSEAIYQAMREDSQFEVDLVVIPDITDESGTETYQFFEDCYSASHIIRAGKQGELCKLQELKPDYVFYTRPYDQYLPVDYRSGQVARYAKTCYCSYAYILTETGPLECMPGIFFRNIYIFFAESVYIRNYNRKRFPFSCTTYRKSEFLGYPITDRFRDSSYGRVRPVFLWTPRWTTEQSLGGSSFFVYKDKLLEYVMEQEAMKLIFRPHPLIFYHLQSTGEMSAEEVEQYILRYQSSKRVRIDENSEYVESFREAGILITDISSMLFEWYVTAKPIIFCDTGAKGFSEVMQRALQGCYIVHDWETLSGCMDMLSKGNDPLKKTREEIAKEISGDGISNAGRNIANYIKTDYMSK